MSGQETTGVGQRAGVSGSFLARELDAIVVGGGIIGRVAALRLVQAGLAVLLVDAPDDGRRPQWGPASFGNAGHVATEQVRPLTSPAFLRSVPQRLFLAGGALDVGWRCPAVWLPWAVRAVRACGRAGHGEAALTALLAEARPAWQRLVDDLERPDLLGGHRHLMLWHDPRAGRDGVAAWGRASTGTATVHPMAQAELDETARHLSAAPVAGLGFEGTGQVSDPHVVMQAVLAAFLAAGGTQVRTRVHALVGEAGRTTVHLDGMAPRARQVLVAAGVGSGHLLRGLGLVMPVIAERGYHVEWQHGGDYDLPPLVFEERALIVSRFGDRLRASSFVEFTDEAAPADPRKWRRLEAHVAALGLPVASPFRRWLGARPTLPDYLPAIGASTAAPGLFVACGHQHLGLTLAPRTAEIMVRLMTGRAPPLSLSPFDPARFGSRRPRSRELDHVA